MKTIQLAVPDNVQTVNRIALATDSFIAGGTIRSVYQKEPLHDIDVFSKDEDAHRRFKELLLKSTNYQHQFSNPMLSRFVLKDGEKIIQTVDAVVPRLEEHLRNSGTPEEVISHFDFTVARAALISETEALVDDAFIGDCEKKRLVILHIVCPLNEVRRIAKYNSYGYSISLTEVLKLFVEYRNRNTEELESLLGRFDLSTAEKELLMKLVYVD